MKVLDDFDFAAPPSLDKRWFAELLRGECLQRRESVILLGNPGAGKTHRATARAAAARAQGKQVRFWRVTELATTLLEAREERTRLRLQGQLAKLDLLVLDEFGYVPARKTGAERLFDVIATADERTSVVVTTNLPFQQWTEVLGSERLTGAFLDRPTDAPLPPARGERPELPPARRPKPPPAGGLRLRRGRVGRTFPGARRRERPDPAPTALGVVTPAPNVPAVAMLPPLPMGGAPCSAPCPLASVCHSLYLVPARCTFQPPFTGGMPRFSSWSIACPEYGLP